MTNEDLIERIREAYDTYRRLPDTDRRFRGRQTGSWPAFVRDFFEAYGHTPTVSSPARPSPEAIDRADETIGWFASSLDSNPRGARAVWLTHGRGLSMRRAGAILGISKTQLGVVRTSAIEAMRRYVNAYSLTLRPNSPKADAYYSTG